MVLLEKLWDDVVAGPQPDKGLGKLRKVSTQKVGMEKLETGESSGAAKSYQRSASMPASPATPTTPTTPTATTPKENVWRSVFHPGSNLATRSIGAQVFDKPTHPNSPTVYDWLYSGDTRSNHR